MPNVNGKKYPYTAEGMRAAKKAAAKKPAVKYGKRGTPNAKRPAVANRLQRRPGRMS
jgi:hypothetical protein